MPLPTPTLSQRSPRPSTAPYASRASPSTATSGATSRSKKSGSAAKSNTRASRAATAVASSSAATSALGQPDYAGTSLVSLPTQGIVSPPTDHADQIALAVSAAIQPLLSRMERLESATTPSQVVASGQAASLPAPLVAPLVSLDPHVGKLWSTVPKTTVDKIITGQFVEFHALLPSLNTTPANPSWLLAGSLDHVRCHLREGPPRSCRGAARLSAPYHKGEWQICLLSSCRIRQGIPLCHGSRASPPVGWIESISVHIDLWRSGRAALSYTTTPNSTDICRLFNRGHCSRQPCRYRHACALCFSSEHSRQGCPTNANAVQQTSGRTVVLDPHRRWSPWQQPPTAPWPGLRLVPFAWHALWCNNWVPRWPVPFHM